MAGFGALVSALVNALKTCGVVKDDQAQVWVTGLNLLGVCGLFGVGAFGVVVDIPTVDTNLNLVAQVLVASANLLAAMGGSKAFYGMARGMPLIGKSHSK